MAVSVEHIAVDLVGEGEGEGIGRAGAYSMLEEHGHRPKDVAGTSAGAITAPGGCWRRALVFAVVAAALGWQTPRLLGRAATEFVPQRSEGLRAEAVIERASGLSAAPQLLVLVRAPSRERLVPRGVLRRGRGSV
jgi:predicted acylesterase/phospholipase RssA